MLVLFWREADVGTGKGIVLLWVKDAHWSFYHADGLVERWDSEVVALVVRDDGSNL